MSKPSLVILLVEDDHQRILIRRYLVNRGLGQREIRIEQSPSGRGSAESWVRRMFVKNVAAYRRRQARAASALIVVIDADAHTVQERLEQLDLGLRVAGKPSVSEGEQVARLVPKRNVETWILCLNQHRVAEDRDYKQSRDDWGGLISPAANTLAQWVHQQPEPPNNCVPSLREGINELRLLNLR